MPCEKSKFEPIEGLETFKKSEKLRKEKIKKFEHTKEADRGRYKIFSEDSRAEIERNLINQ